MIPSNATYLQIHTEGPAHYGLRWSIENRIMANVPQEPEPRPKRKLIKDWYPFSVALALMAILLIRRNYLFPS